MTELEQAQERIAELVDTVRRLENEVALLNGQTNSERTCHDANTRFNAWTCSECKCTQLLMFDDYGEPTLSVDGVASVPNYCPNCGAKVVSE